MKNEKLDTSRCRLFAGNVIDRSIALDFRLARSAAANHIELHKLLPVVQLGLLYWIFSSGHARSYRVLKVFTEHLHGPSPPATSFVSRAKESPAEASIRGRGAELSRPSDQLRSPHRRPAALAALALVHTHGQTARRVHHFSGQNALRTATASAASSMVILLLIF